MIYHNVFEKRIDKSTLLFMADNCPGQNKNMFMIWFMSYLSIVRPHTTLICLRFLVAGHTKNFCDSCFGLCKRSTKGKDILSPRDVVTNYANSGKCNRVVRTDNSGLVWYDWKKFLGQLYKGVIQGISLMHEFEFRTNSPGIVFYKEYVDSPAWKQTSLFKQGVTEDYIKTPDGLVYQSLDKFIVPDVD